MKKRLILVGGGGHCKSVIDVAESCGYIIHGILDLPGYIGQTVLNYPIIGSDDDIGKYVDDALYIVTVGYIKNNSLRIKLHMEIERLGGKFATLIAPTAHVSAHAEIGEGSVIMHHSLVNADAKIGKGCIINSFANIEHDAVIGNYCHISTGVMVNGNCIVGPETFIGSNSTLINGTCIACNTVIGASSLVRKNLVVTGLYAGNPAVLIKEYR